MTLRKAPLWITQPLRHLKSVDVAVGLIGCGVLAAGFGLGRSQASHGLEHQRLGAVNQRLDSRMASLGETWADVPSAGEVVLGELVDGVDGARAWVKGLRQAADRTGFRMRLRWGDPGQPLPVRPEVESVPVIIELESGSVNAGATARMEGFLKYLGMERPPFELSRVQWTGSGAGLRGVLVEGRLWIRNSDI